MPTGMFNFAEILTPAGLAVLAQVILIDLTMAGDNVVIMGTLTSGLPARERRFVAGAAIGAHRSDDGLARLGHLGVAELLRRAGEERAHLENADSLSRHLIDHLILGKRLRRGKGVAAIRFQEEGNQEGRRGFALELRVGLGDRLERDEGLLRFEVLAEAGLDAATIDSLIEERVVIQGSPMIMKELINYR